MIKKRKGSYRCEASSIVLPEKEGEKSTIKQFTIGKMLGIHSNFFFHYFTVELYAFQIG